MPKPRQSVKRPRSASPDGVPAPDTASAAAVAPKAKRSTASVASSRKKHATPAEVKRFVDSDLFFAAVRGAQQEARAECARVDAVRAILRAKEEQLQQLPSTTRVGVRAALQRAVERARMRVCFLENEGPVHQLHRRLKPYVQHHYTMLAAHERASRRDSVHTNTSSARLDQNNTELDFKAKNAFVLDATDVAVDTERAAAKATEWFASTHTASLTHTKAAAAASNRADTAQKRTGEAGLVTQADEQKMASMTRLQRLAGVLASLVGTTQHTHAASAPAPSTSGAPATTRPVAAEASIQDVCPRCVGHPTLRMDPVESVLLCPNSTCTYTRAFHSLMCPALTHEDRSASSRAGPNPTTEMYTTMQQCSAEEPRVVPRSVMLAIMQHLRKTGVPPTPRAVTYDAVTAALKALRLSTYYDQRTQIRARLTGIAPPCFTVQQKATIATLHAVTRHMQAWVDPGRRAQNLQVRLIFLCQSMGWWEHIVAPRFVSGPEGSARYDAVNKLLHAALGWPYYTCADTQRNREIAAAYMAKLEQSVVVPRAPPAAVNG